VRIGELAKSIGCSRKHLAQVFEREVGASPKSYARIVRFETAMARYRRGEIGSIGELAAASGYADQAHFTRDCQAFTGRSPSDLFAIAM
jgi:AraC-like DNA-binding protein